MMDQQTDNVVVKNYNTFKNYLISSIIGVLISTYVIITSIKGYLDNGNQFSFDLLMTSFADGFFVSGVLIGGIGLLVLISGEGIFDIMGYGVGIIIKGFTKRKDHEKYIDYKLRKEAERDGVKISFLAIVGGMFVLLAIICSMIYMM